MTENEILKHNCEICGMSGDNTDFLDLNDWDEWSAEYFVCPQCYQVMQRNEFFGSILLLLSFIVIPIAGFELRKQVPTFLFVYGFNLFRRIYYSLFLFLKIKQDNVYNPKTFFISKGKDQLYLFLLTPIDLITSPFRFFANRINREQ